MYRPDIPHIFTPNDILELTGIAGDDLMRGNWRHGVNDPRNDLEELRRWFWERENTDDRIGDDDALYHHGSNLIQMALGAALLGELRGDSQTLRYIFGIIEQRQKDKNLDKGVTPGPFFIEAMQILLLAAKPQHREALMNAIFEATGTPQGLGGIFR